MPDRWLTYEEAGQLFGLSAEAIRKRSRRLGWKVQPPNDSQGKARILVPDSASLHPAARPAGDRPDTAGHPAGDRADMAELHQRVGRAEGEASVFREAIRAAEARATAVEATLEEERAARADERDQHAAERARWDAERDAWDAERDRLAGERATLREELARREGELAGLREALSRPEPSPVRDAIVRFRTWIEAKARKG